MPSTPQQALGRYGETLAARHLSARGYTIQARNWRCPQGELDLVAHDGTEWVFVEVRTRRAPNTDTAIESITPAKQARVLAAAEAYLAAHDLEGQPWRLDVVVIALTRQGPTIEVIRDAAEW
jgi:putative endonuclease